MQATKETKKQTNKKQAAKQKNTINQDEQTRQTNVIGLQQSENQLTKPRPANVQNYRLIYKCCINGRNKNHCA